MMMLNDCISMAAVTHTRQHCQIALTCHMILSEIEYYFVHIIRGRDEQYYMHVHCQNEHYSNGLYCIYIH